MGIFQKMDQTKVLRKHKNILLTKLREINNCINRSQTSLLNYQNANLEEIYRKTNIENIQKEIQEKKDEKKVLINRLKKVEEGILDTDLQKEYDINKKITELQKRNQLNRKRTEMETKKREQEKYNSIVTDDIEEKKNLKQLSYEIKKSYYHFCQASNSLPEQLQKNLEKMPSNKGYKFKNIIFFGKLPPVEESNIIFERIDKNTLHIHKWEKDFVYLYEKKGKDKKILIEKKPRKTQNFQKNLLSSYF